MSTQTAWIDLSRRAATVLLVVLCLLAVPAMANATFTSAQSAGQVVGTARMETPSNLDGTYSCARNSSVESITVTVKGFSDASPAGSTYAYSLVQGATVRDTEESSSKSATLFGFKSTDSQSTTWTVRVQPTLYRWTGGTASHRPGWWQRCATAYAGCSR